MNNKFNRPELLAPAGSLEKLYVAVQYGADAVYLSGQAFGLRQASDNFTLEELKEGLAFCRQKNVKTYITLNSHFHGQDFQELEQFVIKNGLQKKTKIHYLTPLPNTRLFREAVEKGYITNEFEYVQNLGDLYWERMVNMTKLPDEVFDNWYKRLYALCSKEVVEPTSNKYTVNIKKIH